jgi:hypothetical protein
VNNRNEYFLELARKNIPKFIEEEIMKDEKAIKDTKKKG